MFVIGLVGKTASGKGRVANILEAEFHNIGLTVSRVRFSDSLREFIQELNRRGINLEISKSTMISIAEAGRLAFTPDFLAKSVVRRTRNSKADVCIWDGLRWPDEDVSALMSFNQNVLIAVIADDKKRYKRFIDRSEISGDVSMSFSDFKAMDDRETEKFIPQIVARANRRVPNNESISKLLKRVKVVVDQVVVALCHGSLNVNT